MQNFEYEPAYDLWVVTCFFNPCGYLSRRKNYESFRQPLDRAGIRTITIECALEGREFELNSYDNVIHIRGTEKSLLWQKERLLNIAIERLPAGVDKVAWLDCDVLFENPRWAVETSALLESYSVVQPFSYLVRLGPTIEGALGTELETREGFGHLFDRNPNACRVEKFAEHGHTGLAWAARREIVAAHGLFDLFLSGSGDHFMAHAISGSLCGPCFERLRGTLMEAFFLRWAFPVTAAVAGRLTFAEGRCLHLWHGTKEARRYRTILREFLALGFDPARDVAVAPNGLFEWRSDRTDMRRWAAAYFLGRAEDGS